MSDPEVSARTDLRLVILENYWDLRAAGASHTAALDAVEEACLSIISSLERQLDPWGPA